MTGARPGIRGLRRALALAPAGLMVVLGTPPGTAPVARAGALITPNTLMDGILGGTSCTLRMAVVAANTNAAQGGCPAGSATMTDTVRLMPGTYTLTVPGAGEDDAQAGDLDVKGPLALEVEGAGAWNRTTTSRVTIDGTSLGDRVLDVHSEVTTGGFFGTGGTWGQASGITLTGGTAAGGGVIHVKTGASASLSGVIVKGGKATSLGGGIKNSGTVSLMNSVLEGNSADSGGGIFNDTGTLNITNSTFSGNSADFAGAGILNHSGTVTITNSTISGNQSKGDGGGFANNQGTWTGNNLTVANNTANSDGAGPGSGGGFFFFPGPSGKTTLSNSIIGDNAVGAGGDGPDCGGPGTTTSAGYNLLENPAGCGWMMAVEDVFNNGPLLRPLAPNGGPTLTHALEPASPAVNRGNPAPKDSSSSACEAYDQRGAPRDCDIGAYELVTCFGRAADVIGTEAKDQIMGDAAANVILALGGDDVINGLGNQDFICAGKGNDIVRAGSGNDLASGDEGNDRVLGGKGHDTLYGRRGRDRLLGGGGNNTCDGGAGPDLARDCQQVFSCNTAFFQVGTGVGMSQGGATIAAHADADRKARTKCPKKCPPKRTRTDASPGCSQDANGQWTCFVANGYRCPKDP